MHADVNGHEMDDALTKAFQNSILQLYFFYLKHTFWGWKQNKSNKAY